MKNDDIKDNHSTIDDEDELTVKQIVGGLEKLDEWNPVSTPNLQWFQQHVELEKKRIRKKQWQDLFSFIFVAIFILSLVMTIVYRQPILFLYFQLVGIILLPLALHQNRKKVNHE